MTADPEFGIVYPPWSHRDEESLLDAVLGEISLTHLVVPCVGGPLTSLRIHPAAATGILHTSGGWHYPTDPHDYAVAAARPRSAGWFGKRHVPERIRGAVARRGVRMDARIDLHRVTPLYEHESHLRCRTAWGEELPHALCSRNPDWRALAEATVADLARRGLGGVQWVTADAHPLPVEPPALTGRPVLVRLLNLCFCPACRAAASAREVDADAAARSVRVHVERGLAAEPSIRHEPPAGAPSPEDDPIVNGYATALADDDREWLGRLVRQWSKLRWSVLSRHGASRATGSIDGALAMRESVDHANIDLHSRETGFGLITRVWRPHVDRADSLVRFVHDQRRAGCVRFDFSGVDEAPAEVVRWLHQAIRFAQRED